MSAKPTLITALIALFLATAILGWFLVPSGSVERSGLPVVRPATGSWTPARPPGRLPSLAAVTAADARMVARAAEHDGRPASVDRTEARPVVQADRGQVRPPYVGLREALELLPPYDGTDAGFRAKYAGLGPRELSQVFPLLREISNAEMLDALDLAIEGGLHATEYLAPGARLETARYDIPGEAVNTVVFRAHPLPEGGQECQVVNLDRERFPDWHVRALENLWVSDRLDEAGLGPEVE